MRVTLEGRKIGHLHSVREVGNGRVVSTSTTRFEIDRAGTPLSFESIEEHTETTTGKPLAFESRTRMGGSSSSTVGRIDAQGKLTVEQHNGAAVAPRTLDWPAGAVLSEGARLLEIKAGLAPGTRVSVPTFFGDSMMAATTHLHVIGPERVMLAGRAETLVRVEQSIEIAGARIEGTVWVNPEHQPQRIRLPLLGVALEMIACDRACALAPNQPSDVLTRTLVTAPATLDRADLEAPVRYRVRLAPSAGSTRVIDTAGQRVSAVPGVDREWDVQITPEARDATSPSPTVADTRPTVWLQADDVDVKRLALGAAVGARTDAQRMQQLEAAVRSHINIKNLSVGYASAAETADSRQGDCTEHALLLAAMARSLGIPSRVVSGLAFAPEYVGRKRVFVPHAWTQAWVDGSWRSFDAALRGFDAGHIAFSVGDGDPVGFYHSVSLLGATEIVAATPASVPAPAEKSLPSRTSR
ncbi:MAG: transglutaminase-like domain-containing protein [Lysobacterales bacterium]